MAVAEIGDLEHALDMALKVDFGAAASHDRSSAVAVLGRLESKLTALSAEIVGEYDVKKDWVRAGYRSPAVGVRETANVPAPTAHRLVSVARSLRDMPITSESLRDGSINAAHAMRLRKTATRDAFAAGEELLVGQAKTLTWSQWLKAVAYWEQLADDDDSDPADPDPRDTKAEFHANRTLDGYGELNGRLGPVGFEAFEEALHRIEREIFQTDWSDAVNRLGKDATTADIARTPAQRRAAALVEMAHRATTAPKDGKRPLPLVVIHTDPDTFNSELARVLGIDAPDPLGTARRCETDTGTVIAPPP